MASRPKSGGTGTRRSSTRSRKPATIDLEAKEVVSEAPKQQESAKKSSAQTKVSDTKTEAASNSTEFGRAGSAASKTAAKKAEAETKTAKKAESANKTEGQGKEKPRTEPAKDASPNVVVQKSGGGFFPAIGGAVAAVVVLGLVGQIDGARNLPLIGSLYGGNTGNSGAVQQSQLSELQTAVDRLAQNSGAAEVDLQPINTKLAELETLVSSLSQSISTDTGNLDPALASRLDTVEATMKRVEDDLSKVTQENRASAGVSPDDFEVALNALASRIDGLDQSGITAATDEKISELENKVGDVLADLSALQTLMSKNDSQLSELISQSSKLEDTVATVQASEKVAKSVAVTALATALDNDDSLTLPVSSVEALMGESSETARLKELSKTGIPKLKDLVAQLDDFSSSIGNATAVSKDATLSDRFWANAQSLVTFRSSGPREGDDPLAILSRVRAEVSNGGLQSAKTEWLKLPSDVQALGADWVKLLDRRIEAYALQKEISAKLSLQAG
ncbi:MAG: hypothetical protein AAGA53_03035 [Pseudomonadota bacterium]